MKPKRTFFHFLSPQMSITPISLRQALSYRTERIPLRVVCIERKVFSDYIREKVIFDVERGLSSVAWVCRPRTAGRFPGILCCHGAGPGKDPLVGQLNGEPCLEYHKLVAVRLAQRGYVTITPDRRGFGERAAVPYCSASEQYRTTLEKFYRRTRRTSLLTLDIRDGIRTLDVLTEYADATQIGCLGVYDGATVAANVAALDKRITVVILTCFTGDAELCRLISPRFLQIQIAAAALITPTDPDAMRRAYGMGQASRNLEIHYFDGVLELDFQAAARLLDQRLKQISKPL